MENFGKPLNRLMRICLKTKETYLKAAEHTSNPELRSRFQAIAQRRQELADDLENEIGSHSNVHPDEKGDLLEFLHRSWMGVKSAIPHMGSSGEKAVLEACRDTDQAALDAFDDELQGNILYSNLKTCLVKCRTAISEDFQDIDRMYLEYFPPASKEI
jgi:uncharacterized protein (TIGR02284 family)